MGRFRGKKPSPAMVTSIVALVLAVTGTSVAGIATISVLSKKEKKQTRKIAKDEINKAAPGLSVANATNAQNANAANTVQNGAIGTASFAPSIPAAHLTRTAPQSVEDSVVTPVAFDSERYDTAAMHDNATNSSRLTAPVAGIYIVVAQVSFFPDPDGQREVLLTMNGTTDIAFQGLSAPTGIVQVTTQVRLQAGDYVEAHVFQDSGGFLDVTKTNAYSPEFSMTWLAPGP